MLIRFKAICKRVRRNNGIIEALFTRLVETATDQEEHILVNVSVDRGGYEEGSEYWIVIEPAFPH